MYRSVICSVLFVCALLAALAASAPAAYVVRVSDLQYSPTPPNPIKVVGRVVSERPLKLNDGSGEITVVGVTAPLSDFLVVTGDWDGSVLTVSGAVEQVLPPAPCEMVYIPAGPFLMGNNGNEPFSYSDELPQHEVHLSGYWIGKYAVTRGEYRQFMDAGGYSNPAYWSSDGWIWKSTASSYSPSVGPPRTQPNNWAADQDWCMGAFTQTDSHPVVGVSYYEAEAFCAWARGHLPTEAQWEKAARWTGSYPNVYPWGNVSDAEKCNNWFDTNPAGGGYGRCQTTPVGSYPAGASPYGLQDMAGNVWEWCGDWYVSYPGSTTPFDYTGSKRVLRGGCWHLYHVNYARCAVRASGNSPGGGSKDYGFRLARDVAAVATPTFDPDGGTYGEPVAVTVSCATIGATMHYTTNGIDPTESDDVVASGGQATVSQNATLKARAFKAGFTPSSVRAAAYTVYVATPQFSPDGGLFTGSVAVTVTCATSDATIHYSTTGVDPTESDPVVASGGQVKVSPSAALKARAFKAGWTPSAVKTSFFSTVNSDCEMIYIPAGSFLMGNNGSEPLSSDDELPQHSVYLSGYWIGKYEVTRGEYRQFMDAGGYSNPAYWSSDGWNWKLSNSRTEPDYWAADQDWGPAWGTDPQPFTQTDSHPVVGVSYYEAEAYCAWAGGHLPTEAQWEKAARWTGSYPYAYPWGDVLDWEKCNNHYDHNPAGGGYRRCQTAPVGSYPSGASPYGLQDMAGNVWEWVADWYSDSYYSVSPSSDPQGPTSGGSRNLRGSGWTGYDYYGAPHFRCAVRSYVTPNFSYFQGGFRLAR